MATDRGFGSHCLTHLPDGSLIVNQGDQLLVVDMAGRMRRFSRPLTVPVVDCDAGPDGSVMVISEASLLRVRADGSRVVLFRRRSGDPLSAVAALVGGSAAVATGTKLLRVGPTGIVRTIARAPSVGSTGADVSDVCRLPDGSLAFVQSGSDQIDRLTPDGHIRPLLELGVHALPGMIAPRPDGGLLVAADNGLFTVSAARLITPVVSIESFVGDGGFLASTRESLARAGTKAEHVSLAGVVAIDASPDGTPMALVTNPIDLTTRVVAIGPPGRIGRLAVAVAPQSRVLVPRGVAEIFSTHAASARVDVLGDGRLLSSAHTVLRAGENRIHVHVPAGATAPIIRVTAAADHRVARHAMSFVPRARLTDAEFRRLLDVASTWGGPGGDVMHELGGCRRRSATTYVCQARTDNECCDSNHGRAVIRLESDGLARFTEYGAPGGGQILDSAVLEPR